MTKREQMNILLKNLKNAESHAAMRDVLLNAAGVNVASEVPDDKVEAVIKALDSAPSASLKSFADLDPAAIYRRWNENFVRAPR